MVKEIEQRVQAGGTPMTRWETVFVKTNKKDLVKYVYPVPAPPAFDQTSRLIPFILILLILEEALPLFVLYAPFLLPSTCLLVSQRNRIITTRATKQSSLVSSSLDVLPRIAGLQEANPKLICG
jgi:LETM1 and EF-hand domain-containing protein 1